MNAPLDPSDARPISPAAAYLRGRCRAALDGNDPQPRTLEHVRAIIDFVVDDAEPRIVQQLGDRYGPYAASPAAAIAAALHAERQARPADVPAPAPAPLDPATQARVIADSVDLRNPDWRTCLAVDVAAVLGGTRIDPLPDGHEAAVPDGAPGDREHTPCPHEHRSTT